MADIALRQADFEGALNLYNELLNKNPSMNNRIVMSLFFLVKYFAKKRYYIFGEFFSE